MSDHHDILPETARYLDLFLALTEVAKTLTSSLDLSLVLEGVMKHLSQLMRPENWSLLLVDKEAGELYFEIVVGDAADSIKEMRLPIGEGIAGWVVERNEAVVSPKVSDDPRFSGRVDQASGFVSSSIACAPLTIRGEVLGVIELVKGADDPEPYTEQDLVILKPFVDFAAIAIDNARSFERVQDLTIRDDWTGLYNARFLHDFLTDESERARRHGTSWSVVFLDLDNFKTINDTHGHGAGSGTLRRVAGRLQGLARLTDRVVRYGGDEFVVILPDTDKAGALRFAERARVHLEASRFEGLADVPIEVCASLGVSSYPGDGETGDDLLEAADRAMYRAKEAGRNRVVDAADMPPAAEPRRE